MTYVLDTSIVSALMRSECASRTPSKGDQYDELRLEPVVGLRKPTQLWSSAFDFFVVDEGHIVKWSDRGPIKPIHWSSLAPDDGVYLSDWSRLLFHKGVLSRSPNQYWPKKYTVTTRPAQVVQVGFKDCYLSDGRVGVLGD